MPGWAALVPAFEAEVGCTGSTHRIGWSRGKLRLLDHDVGAERALAAMGGEPPLCLDVFDAWPWSGDEVEVLDFLASGQPRTETIPSRAHLIAKVTVVQASLQTTLGARGRAATHTHTHTHRIQSWVEKRWRLGLLSQLPQHLQDVLAATLVVGCQRRWWFDESFRTHYGRQFQRVVESRALPLLESTLQSVGRRLGPRTTLACWVLPPGERASLSGWAVSGGAGAALSLPLSWLPEVYARGLGVVDECFVLEAEAVPDRVRARAVRWERRAGCTIPVTADAVLTRCGVGWSLSWTLRD